MQEAIKTGADTDALSLFEAADRKHRHGDVITEGTAWRAETARIHQMNGVVWDASFVRLSPEDAKSIGVSGDRKRPASKTDSSVKLHNVCGEFHGRCLMGKYNLKAASLNGTRPEHYL